MKTQNIILLIAFLLSTTFSFGQFGTENIIVQSEANGTTSLFTVDIDNDGDMDILSSSRYDNKIAWYENIDGNGTFGSQHVISTSATEARCVYSCDIDGDGDNDVLSASTIDNKIAWYENTDGNGTFGPQLIITTSASYPYSVYSCDIDGDGDNDVLSTSTTSVDWYENIDGNGTFGSEQNITTSVSGARSVSSCDIDGDGDNDVLSASYNDNDIAWYENTDGNGTFGIKQIISGSCTFANKVNFCDVDGDGDNDVLSASYSGVYWYENTDGLGDFGSFQVISSANEAYSINPCDVDGDGDNDMIFTSYATYRVAWSENTDGLGTFGSLQIISTDAKGPLSVISCDIDNDGDNDVFSGSFFDDKVAWYENTDGLGTFGSQQIITITCAASSLVFAIDIDNDGDNDVLSASQHDNKIAWYENIDGNGTFGFQQIICDTVYGAISVYSIDIDSDGDMDVLSASKDDDKISWYENINGNGTFGVQQIICDTVDGAFSVFSCDIDGDGDNDVLSASSSDDKIAWYENIDGNGNFGVQQIITTIANTATSVYSCDIDGDGDNDVLSASMIDDKIAWYENTDGNGSFGSQQIISDLADGASSVYSCDIDGDGDNDVLSASASDDKIAWYENLDGNGSFGSQQIITILADYTRSVYANDIDGDGDNDVLSAAPFDDKIYWYENLDGNGSFGSQQTITTTSNNPMSVYSCDIDGDGDYDVLSASVDDDKIAWYENYYNSFYKINGKIFFDKNQNGEKDSLEIGLDFIQTELNPNALASFSNQEGKFWFATNTGDYVLTYNDKNYWELTTDSTEFHVTLSDSIPFVDSLFFGFYPDTIITDLTTTITSSNDRCNTDINFWINYINNGTTKPNGLIELILDDSLTYISSAITPDSIIGQNIYWHFDTLNFFSEGMIQLVVHTPDFNSIGDTIASIVNIYTTDVTGTNMFTYTLSEILTCSYDPNDKLVSPKGTGIEGIISKDEILEYTVRFQNTGNDTAINIKIRDQIDANLNIESIELLGSSHHPVDVYIQQNRWLVFQFDSIMLPDSTANFLGSRGFVKYRMAIDSTVLPNTQIHNTANIFFDNNPAVITNTVLNTVECFIAPIAPDIYLSDTLLIASTIYDVQWFLNDSIIAGATDTSYYPLQDGDYTVLVTDSNGCSSFSNIYTYIGVGLSEIEQGLIINVYPNPFQDYTTIEFSKTLGGEYDFVIYNITGSEVQRYSAIKSNTLQIHKADIKSGVYIGKLINIKDKTEEGTVKLVIE